MRIATISIFLTIQTVLLFVSGCGSTPAKKYEPSTLLVFPIVDLRKVRKYVLPSSIDFIDADWLLESRYAIVHHAFESSLSFKLTEQDLIENNVKALRTITSNGERYALLIFMHVLEDGLMTSVKYEATAYLVNIKRGKVEWSTSRERDQFQLGIITTMIKRALTNPTRQGKLATEFVVKELLLNIPALIK